ncbi:MAG: TetR/AcrR family transcriptional regulator [Actinomycetota bacterium]
MDVDRKPRSDGEETRASVLDAADRLFAANGFDGTSLAAISADSGVSPPLIKHHFGGKEELWREAKRRVVQRFVAAQALPDPDGPLDEATVRDAFHAYFDYARANPAIIRFGLWVRLRGELDDWGGEAEVFGTMVVLVEQGQRQGLLRADVPAFDLLMAFGGMVRMWVLDQPHFSLLLGEDPDDDARAEAYFDNALRLIRP